MTFHELIEYVSLVSGTMTIIGIGGLISWGFRRTNMQHICHSNYNPIFIFNKNGNIGDTLCAIFYCVRIYISNHRRGDFLLGP